MRVSLAKVVVAMGLAGCAWGQKYEPPPPALTTAPCVPTKKTPCTQPDVTPVTPSTVEKFPFPGEVAAPAASAPGSAEKFPFPGEPAAPAANDAEKTHPFPGDTPETPGSLPGGGSSSSSASSSSSSSAGGEDAPAEDAPKLPNRFARKHLPKVEDKDQREAQDIEVSRYYTEAGDYNAAYLRAKDAVATIADDPEAHYVLAGAAAKMKKKDEAVAEYKLYVQMEPDGRYVKQAGAALKELGK